MAWPSCSRRALLQAGLLAMALGRPWYTSEAQDLVSCNGLGLYLTHEIPLGLMPALAELPGELAQLHLIWSKVGYEDWDWSHYDAILNPLLAAGKRLILMVGWSPRQHELGRSGRNLLDADGALDVMQVVMLERLLVAAMRRYPGPHIWCWEEEPDDWWDGRNEHGLNGGWGGRHGEFFVVLRAMARARDAANGGAVLALPAVARENWAPIGERPSFDIDFLPNLAALGGFEFVDCYGCNYYAPGFYPWHGNSPYSVIVKLQKVRDSLPWQHRNKPLFVNTGHVLSNASGHYRMGAADYVTQSIAHLLAAPFLHGLPVVAQTQFCWQPRVEGDIRWGLTDEQGALNESGKALARMIQAIPSKPIGATRIQCPGKDGYRLAFSNGSSKNIVWSSCQDRDDDGIIGASEIQEVATHWRVSGECLAPDWNNDGRVDVVDIQEIARRFGERC